jgi:putative methyltransferase
MSSSPYHAAGKMMSQIMAQKKSIKSVAFSKSKLTCNKSTYATVCNTVQHKRNIDLILNHEGGKLRKAVEMDKARNPGMMYVLLYELLWGPYKGIRGGGKLKRVIMKQENALKAAKQKLIKDNTQRSIPVFPRCLRVNKLKATTEEIVEVLQSELKKANKDGQKDEIYVDPHVPDLIVLSPKTRIPWHDLDIVKDGKVILQGKSSCFSALALVHGSNGNSVDVGDVIDACAAPGNKTSHLASLIYDQNQKNKKKSMKLKKTKVFGFDRSSDRLSILKTRMSQVAPLVTDPRSETAKSSFPVEICPTLQDFLKAEPSDKLFRNVKSILLDPSCSGSGIVDSPDRFSDVKDGDDNRVESLSNFQLVALKHAMSFPKVDRIVYSTCSVHKKENEDVVASALKEMNEEGQKDDKIWKLVSPWALVHWKRRGFSHDDLTEEESKCLIRANGLDGDDTNGFFVAYFERSAFSASQSENKDETQSLINVCKGIKGIYNGEFKPVLEEKNEAHVGKVEKVADSTPDKIHPSKKMVKGDDSKKDELQKFKEKKVIPKKAAKRLEWKRKQKEKRAERLKKQKAAKVAKELENKQKKS